MRKKKKSKNSYLKAALRTCKLGRAVFPCEPRGKKPIVAGGRNAASKNKIDIKEFWQKDTPNANIGVATGIESGFFAVDIDGVTGKKSLAKLKKEYGNFPKTQKRNLEHIRWCHFSALILQRLF